MMVAMPCVAIASYARVIRSSLAQRSTSGPSRPVAVHRGLTEDRTGTGTGPGTGPVSVHRTTVRGGAIEIGAMEASQPISITDRESGQPASQFLARLRNPYFFSGGGSTQLYNRYQHRYSRFTLHSNTIK